MWVPGVVSLKKVLTGRGGFTLIEVVVGVTLLSSVSVMVMIASFQVVNSQRSWRDDVTATKELRHMGSWFARDSINTMTTTLADGLSDNASTTIHWTDVDGVFHTATYSLSGDVPPTGYCGISMGR